MTLVKIVGQRETSRFVRINRALTSAVAHFGSVRTFPSTREDQLEEAQRINEQLRAQGRES
ncbi:hypothetical protein [Streptomyces sp. NPDC054783]